MRRGRFSVMVWCLCCLAAVVLTRCGSGKKSAGESCQVTDECNSSLECRGRKCRSPLPLDPPVARARITPESARVGDALQLDASQSSDPLGDTLGLRYAWKVVTRPEKSKAAITNQDQVIATFTPDVPGDYSFEMAVSIERSGKVLSAKATASIKVDDAPNEKPVADAGSDQLVPPGFVVKLDGSKSRDPEGGTLTYQWTLQTKPEGSQATLSDKTSAKPEFSADKEGKYILSLIVTDVRGESSAPDTLTIDAMEGADLTPEVKKVSPGEGPAYETKFKLVVEGDKFVKGARVRIGKPDFETTVSSSNKLEATIDLARVGAGEHIVYVINPNGRSSAQENVKFRVKQAAAPKLISLTPGQGHVGQPKITVIAKGQNFIQGRSEVAFQTVPLPTRVKSSTELEFDVDLRSTALGDYPVKVINPGNQTSNALTFRVLDKLLQPVLRVLNPPSGVTGTRMEFSVHGQGFGEGAVIYFDGQPIPSKRKTRDEVAATPQLDLTNIKAGEYDVWVKNPDGQDSNKEKFRVRDKDPAPKLSRILPFTLFLDEKSDNVAIYGTDFLPGVRLMLGSNEIKGNFGKVEWKSDTYIVATVDLTDTSKWTAGDVDAIAINPNGKKSNPFKISLSHRIPSIDGMLPSSWVTKCDTDVEIQGRNFLPRVVVRFGSNLVYSKTSTTHPLTYVDDQTLRFKLKATTMTAGSYNVVVENGPIAKDSTTFSLGSTASPAPIPGYISPAFGRADTKVMITVQADFSNSDNLRSMQPGAVVEVGGKPHPTTCQLSSSYCYSLDANLDLSGYKPGIYDLVVVNPCGVRGPALSFVIEPAPLPYISAMEPAYAHVGDKTKFVLKGGHFTKKHTLVWNGTTIPTVYKSDKELETVAPIDFSNATVGDMTVVLTNDNGLSATTKFSVLPSFTPKITGASNNVQPAGALQDISITGTGFVVTSAVYLDGKRVNSRFVSATEIVLRGLDTTGFKEGMYLLQVRNGSRNSNYYPLFLNSTGGPTVNYLSPSGAVASSKSSLSVYLYGEGFSQSPASTVIVTGPDNKDYSSSFKVTAMYTTFGRGDLAIGALKQGRYIFQVKNPDGALSNRVVFTVSPPPPPTATSVVPTFGFRGNNIQRIQIRGTNFAPGDQVIFDNNLLNPIPGSVTTPTALEATLNLSKVKAARAYDVYVRRCHDTLCTKFDKTAVLKFNLNNPPCSAINCTTELLPANSEKCDTSGGNVCRPVCTTTADCTNHDKTATWTCQGGFCK